MSELEAQAGVEAAPEPTPTVAPEVPEVSPETTEAELPKTFTQEELDAAIVKRLAREQRKWEREQARRVAPSASAGPLEIGDFADTEAYVEAVAGRKATEMLAQREREREQATVLDAYQDREEEARGKYDDFEQVAYNPNLPITPVMAQTIQASEDGPDLIYWLGTNPKEAARISKLPGVLQAKEIGRISDQLAANPPVKRTSTAPTPIAPVNARANGATSFDTTDPRSIKTMSTSEWIEAERQRIAKKLGAQRR